MAGEELRGISEDTKDMLEGQVKKGKARKFILICKGASIKTLIVFKKGPYGPKIMKAKKEGFKGEAFCGVIVGKGVSLTMQLAGNSAVADAMKTEGSVSEGEPCKIAKLRQFFQEEGDLKFKPEFAIVTQVGDVVGVDESDDDNVGGESSENPPEEPPAENEATDAPASPDTKMAAKLAAAIKQLKPLMEQVIGAQPDRKGDLVGQMTEIVQQVKASQFEDAKTRIVEFGKLLKQLAAGGTSADTKSAPDSAALAKKLTEALSKMTPLIKQALAANPDSKAEILKPASAIKELIAQAQVADAKTRLVEYSLLLKSLVAAEASAEQAAEASVEQAAEATPGVSADRQALAEFEQRLTALEASYRSVVAASPDDAATLTKLYEGSQKFADQGDFAKAHKAIDALENQIEKIDSTEIPDAGEPDDLLGTGDSRLLATTTRVFSSALAAWTVAKQIADQEIEKLQKVVLEKYPEAQKAVDRLNEIMEMLSLGLGDLLDGGVSVTTMTEADEIAARALDVVTQYQKLVAADPLVSHVDANPFVSIKLGAVLNGVLRDIVAKLNQIDQMAELAA